MLYSEQEAMAREAKKAEEAKAAVFDESEHVRSDDQTSKAATTAVSVRAVRTVVADRSIAPYVMGVIMFRFNKVTLHCGYKLSSPPFDLTRSSVAKILWLDTASCLPKRPC